jgi:hypothetical protein
MNKQDIHDLSSELKDYARIQTRILELEIKSKTSTAGAVAVSGFVITFVVMVAFLFMNLSLGLYLSSLFNSLTKGFLCIGGLYGLIALVFLVFRKKFLEFPVRDRIIASMTH